MQADDTYFESCAYMKENLLKCKNFMITIVLVLQKFPEGLIGTDLSVAITFAFVECCL